MTAAPAAAARSAASHKPSGRGRAVLATDWWPRELPDGVTISPRTLVAHDGDVSRGLLFQRGAATTVACLSHPRVDMRRHPAIPELLEAGYAVWAHAGRNVGNDLVLVHETALLDVAAGMVMLREEGFDRIVLLGFSGGSGLYGFYTEQSLLPAADRIVRTPSGKPVPLAEAEMPAPDRLALIAPHPGQGRLLLNAIDPSVAVEGDALSLDAGLDPFDPANGWRAAPEGGATYAPEFVERYREAQRARVARIDERAREMVDVQLQARRRYKSGEGSAADLRASTVNPIITTYRSDADLRCMDLGLDANERTYGSVISPRPEVSNYGVGGFGRLTTPESWLSTWSGISSNAALERTAAGVTIPSLVIEYTGDRSVFPSDIRTTLDALATDDKRHVQVRADHFGKALDKDAEPGMTVTVRALAAWLDGGAG